MQQQQKKFLLHFWSQILKILLLLNSDILGCIVHLYVTQVWITNLCSKQLSAIKRSSLCGPNVFIDSSCVRLDINLAIPSDYFSWTYFLEDRGSVLDVCFYIAHTIV